MSEKTVIKIEFDSKEAAMGFANWLCGSGEQDYWQWMECQDEPSVIFHYHGTEDETESEDDPDSYGKFMADLTIRTTPYDK